MNYATGTHNDLKVGDRVIDSEGNMGVVSFTGDLHNVVVEYYDSTGKCTGSGLHCQVVGCDIHEEIVDPDTGKPVSIKVDGYNPVRPLTDEEAKKFPKTLEAQYENVGCKCTHTQCAIHNADGTCCSENKVMCESIPTQFQQ